MTAESWRAKGRLIEVNGFEHFVYQSKNNKPHLLILHGYPTCGYDYHKVLPQLEKHYCVVVHDHLGFGFSDKPLDYSYSLMEQTDQALKLWNQLGVKNAVVLAHDYGTSIATELLARLNIFQSLPFELNQLVLCNGSMHVELANLRLIQKLLLNKLTGPLLAKLTSKKIFTKNIRNVSFNKEIVSDDEINALWKMVTHNNGRQVLPKVTQYIKQRYTFWHRWIGALKQTDVQTHIIWAEEDPVAVLAMATLLNQEIKHSSLTTIPESGHFPMLETPDLWVNAVIKALADF